jgi:hypothetical protein
VKDFSAEGNVLVVFKVKVFGVDLVKGLGIALVIALVAFLCKRFWSREQFIDFYCRPERLAPVPATGRAGLLFLCTSRSCVFLGKVSAWEACLSVCLPIVCLSLSLIYQQSQSQT